jgi:hypothetical protein
MPKDIYIKKYLNKAFYLKSVFSLSYISDHKCKIWQEFYVNIYEAPFSGSASQNIPWSFLLRKLVLSKIKCKHLTSHAT